MLEVIYYTDPDDPRYGTTETVEHPDPPKPVPIADPVGDLTAQVKVLQNQLIALSQAISPEAAAAVQASSGPN